MKKLLFTFVALVSTIGVIKMTDVYTTVPERVVSDEFVPMAPQMDVTSYVLIDAESRVVLAEYNADKQVDSKAMAELLTTYSVGQALAKGDAGVGVIKTEYLQAEGYSFVSSAKQGGRRLMAIVIGAKNSDVKSEYSNILLKYGFDLYAYWDRQDTGVKI